MNMKNNSFIYISLLFCFLFYTSQVAIAQDTCIEVIAEVEQKIDSTSTNSFSKTTYQQVMKLLFYAQDICPDEKQEIVRKLLKKTYSLIEEERDKAIHQAKVSEYRRLLNLAKQETIEKNQIDATSLIVEAYNIGLPPDEELFSVLDYLFQNSINGKIPILKNIYKQDKQRPLVGIANDGNKLIVSSNNKSYEVIDINNKNKDYHQINSNKYLLGASDTINQAWKSVLYGTKEINELRNRILLIPQGYRAAILYNIKGEKIIEFNKKNNYSYFATFTADGKQIIILTYNGQLKIYDLDGNELKTLGDKDEVDSAYISPDGSRIITFISDISETDYEYEDGYRETVISYLNRIKLWSIEGDSILSIEKPGPFPLPNIAFSPTEKKIISYYSNVLAVYDYDGKILKHISGFPDTDYISMVKLSPDGQKMLLQLSNLESAIYAKFSLWDIDGNKLCDFPKDILCSGEPQSAFQFMPNESKLLIDHGVGKLGMWNCICDSITTFKHSNSPSIIKFSPKEKKIITFAGTEELNIWDYNGNYLDSLITNLNVFFYSLELSPDEKEIRYSTDKCYFLDMDGELLSKLDISSSQYVLGGSGLLEFDKKSKELERKYKLWELKKVPALDIKAMRGNLRRVELAFNEKKLYTYSFNKNQIKIWDLEGNLLHEENLSINSETPFFGEKASHIVLWNNEKGRLWNIETNDFFDLGKGFAPQQVYINTKHERITALFYDYSVKIWDYKGNLLFHFNPKDLGTMNVTFNNNPSFISNNLLFSKDESKILIQSWDKTYFVNLEKNIFKELKAHKKWLMSSKLTDDGMFITGGWDGKVILWNDIGEKINEFDTSKWRVEHLDISKDKSKILTASGGYIKIWDVKETIPTLAYAFDIPFQLKDPNSISLSPSCNEILILIAGKVEIRNLQGELLKSLPSNGFYYTPDNQRIISHSRKLNELTIYTKKGHFIKNIKNQKEPKFNPNGKNFASKSSSNNDLMLFDFNGNQLSILSHITPLRGTYFSPSGDMTITTELNIANLWDSKGNLLKTSTGYTGALMYADFFKNEQKIITYSDNGEVKIWPAPVNSINWLKDIQPYHHLRRTEDFIEKYKIQDFN